MHRRSFFSAVSSAVALPLVGEYVVEPNKKDQNMFWKDLPKYEEATSDDLDYYHKTGVLEDKYLVLYSPLPLPSSRSRVFIRNCQFDMRYNKGYFNTSLFAKEYDWEGKITDCFIKHS